MPACALWGEGLGWGRDRWPTRHRPGYSGTTWRYGRHLPWVAAGKD